MYVLYSVSLLRPRFNLGLEPIARRVVRKASSIYVFQSVIKSFNRIFREVKVFPDCLLEFWW